jgi:hypothetical protein
VAEKLAPLQQHLRLLRKNIDNSLIFGRVHELDSRGMCRHRQGDGSLSLVALMASFLKNAIAFVLIDDLGGAL